MSSDTNRALAVRRRKFQALPGFSRLFCDYCEDFERVSSFYAADYRDPVNLSDQRERVLSFARDRSMLVDVLLEQNEQWGLDEATRQNIERLSSDGCTAVVTGQQVGLFGGPLYTVYKTTTAIKLAAKWSTEDHPVVPIFWLEGEDHDLEEVRSVRLLGKSGLFIADYDAGEPPDHGNRGPVGRLELMDSVRATIDLIDQELPPSDFHDEVVETIRDTYRPGVTFRDAFARLTKRLFPSAGLIFISADDRRLKDAALPLFLKEIGESDEVRRRVEEASQALEADYHVQVRVSPTNLFFTDEKGRSAVDADPTAGTFSIKNHPDRLSLEQLVGLIEENPSRVSPNVVLRPVLQDRLIPTLAYVAGPGEVAYFAQFKPVYEWAGQPMPIIFPRASATFVESRIEKIMARYDLELADVGTDIEGLFKSVVIGAMGVDIPARFAEASSRIDESVEEVRDVVVRTDQTLEKALEATRVAMLNELGKLQGKVLKAEKRHHEEDRARLERLQQNLFPSGALQERGLSIIPFLNKYGFGFVDDLMQALSLDTRQHQVLSVDS